MTESERDRASFGSARARALLAEFRARHDAWRQQAQELTRLRDQLDVAADHETDAIVTAARDEIRRIILNARRELGELSADLRAAAELRADIDLLERALERRGGGNPAETPPGAREPVPESVLKARHDLRRLLHETRPELDALSVDAPATEQMPIATAPVPGVATMPARDVGLTRWDTRESPVHRAFAVASSELAGTETERAATAVSLLPNR